MKDWFTIDQVDESTYIISEYRHWEETHCYLLIGNDRALLIDTGLGISNIYEQVSKLTNKPVAAVATHIHWDHIGGHKYFPEFYAHDAELDWLNGKFPLPLQAVKHIPFIRDFSFSEEGQRYISEWIKKHPKFEDDEEDTYVDDEDDDDY